MKSLVLAPHADDEIIGCGGYLDKLISNGNEVDVVYLTTPDDLRKEEINAVKEYMGFGSVFFLNQGQGRGLYKSEKLMSVTLDAIRSSAPNILLFPHSGDQDQDHKFLYDLARECSFLCESEFMIKPHQSPVKVDILLGYEVWCPMQNPNLVVNIDDHIAAKGKAMKLYGSQMRCKDFVSMFNGLNQYRGISSGVGNFAECFEVYKITENSLLNI